VASALGGVVALAGACLLLRRRTPPSSHEDSHSAPSHSPSLSSPLFPPSPPLPSLSATSLPLSLSVCSLTSGASMAGGREVSQDSEKTYAAMEAIEVIRRKIEATRGKPESAWPRVLISQDGLSVRFPINSNNNLAEILDLMIASLGNVVAASGDKEIVVTREEVSGKWTCLEMRSDDLSVVICRHPQRRSEVMFSKKTQTFWKEKEIDTLVEVPSSFPNAPTFHSTINFFLSTTTICRHTLAEITILTKRWGRWIRWG
jgi:hypothetical protein